MLGSNWQVLFNQAIAAAVEFDSGQLGVRLRKEYEIEMFRDILSELGIKKFAERIEYRCDIANLPDDTGSPLKWLTTQELKWNKHQVARFASEIVKGSFDFDPEENMEDFVQDWIHHHEYTHGFDCIAIGFSGDKPCALVVAQIEKETGWSRLAYVGIIPELRGRGLGKWVHRHGFKMMKDQGGKLYHGGTHGDNKPMQKLFISHGCKVFCEMEEWFCNLKTQKHEI